MPLQPSLKVYISPSHKIIFNYEYTLRLGKRRNTLVVNKALLQLGRSSHNSNDCESSGVTRSTPVAA